MVFFFIQVQYPQSKCSRLSLVRDLPPVAGSIIWAKQIDHQLTAYLKRVEDVLGKNKVLSQVFYIGQQAVETQYQP